VQVSQLFTLGKDQSTLEFVDVEVTTDVPLFLMPSALLKMSDREWADNCVVLIKDFFQEVINRIKAEDYQKAESLLKRLENEPNETHLGLSTRHSRGRSSNSTDSRNINERLVHGGAVERGLISELEDTALFIEGIAADKISDMTTDIIREKLIEFTQSMCDKYEIPMREEVDCGLIWDIGSHTWKPLVTKLPYAEEEPLILVPKELVRRALVYSYRSLYYRTILSYFQDQEMEFQQSLVEVLHDQEVKKPTKKDLSKRYPGKKGDVYRYASENPSFIDEYREIMEDRIPGPLSNERLKKLIKKSIKTKDESQPD